MFKKLFLISVVVTFQLFSINLRLLKGTTQVLPESDQWAAPFHGVPYAEGVAENYYNLSIKNIKVNIAKEIADSKQPADEIAESKTLVEEYLKNLADVESATSKLVNQMFHRAGGQFQLTAAPDNPVRQLSPKNIGEILKIISQTSRNLVGLSVAAEFTSNKKEKQELLKKQSVVEAKELVNLEFNLEEYLKKLGLKNGSGKEFKPKDWRSFVRNLLNSLHESDINNPQASFAPGTTEGILLGYMLRKCNNKQDLEAYFQGLTGKEIVLPDQRYSDSDIQEIIERGINFQDLVSFGDWLTCAFYDKNYQLELPQIGGTSEVSYDQAIFPDCVETTIRNLCNFVTYDGSSFGIAPEGITLSSALQSFYMQQQCDSPLEVSNKKVHQIWSDMLKGMVGIVSRNIKIVGHNESALIPDEYKGFMKIDDQMISSEELAQLKEKEIMVGTQKIIFRVKTVGDVKYLLIPNNSNLVGYDLLPITSNIVVALNRLFELNLYDPKDIFNSDFVQKNFLKICNKFDWKLQTLKLDNTEPIDIDICKKELCFTIHILKNHGYISIAKNKFSKLLVDEDLLSNITYKKNPQEVIELIPLIDNVLSIQKLFDISGKNPQIFVKLLKNIDVRNPDKSVEIIKQTLGLHLQNELLDNYISKLIMQLPTDDDHYITSVIESCKNVSLVIRNTLKIILDRFIIKNNIMFVLSINTKLVRAGILTASDKEKIMTILEKGIASSYKDVHKATLECLVLYIMQELATPGILNPADKDKIMIFLEKGMEHQAFVTLGIIQKLLELRILTANDKEKIMSILKKAFIPINPLVERFSLDIYNPIKFRALSIIKELLKERILTAIDTEKIKPYIKKLMESKDQSIVDLAKNIYQELKSSESFISQSKNRMMNFLRGTGTNLQAHKPYATDVVGFDLAQRGMSPEEVGQEFDQQYKIDRARLRQIEQQVELDDEYQVPNLDRSREQFEEQQWQMRTDNPIENKAQIAQNYQAFANQVAGQKSFGPIRPKALGVAKSAARSSLKAVVK